MSGGFGDRVWVLFIRMTLRSWTALYCWILEILYCDPKGYRALLRVPSTLGRSVCLRWEHSKPKGLEGTHLRARRDLAHLLSLSLSLSLGRLERHAVGWMPGIVTWGEAHCRVWPEMGAD